MIEVVPLGTGSAIPTRGRHLAGCALRREGRLVLFDCGEGTQLQLIRAELSPARLDAVCITHLHGDHFYGLPGLLTTLALLERTAPLTVVGPEGIRQAVTTMPGLADGRLPFAVRWVELPEGFEHALVYESEAFTVEARPLEHRVACAGFRLQERTRLGRINGEKARAAGVTEGRQFEALKRRETITLADGSTLGPEGLVGPERPGAAFAYVLDTRPCAGGRRLAEGADLLLHEATFADDLHGRAVDTGHSTAREAAEVARDAGARRLLLTHFSARYTEVTALVSEARRIFPNTDAAEELSRYSVQAPEPVDTLG